MALTVTSVATSMNTSSGSKPKLLPVSVPWQVSVSAAYLRADLAEVQSDRPIRADFVGFFARNEITPATISGTAVTVTKTPPPFVEDSGAPSGVYHQVRVVFRDGYWLRLSPGFSESQVLDEQAYDWSDVPGRLLPNESTREALERVRSQWLQTGICPNPRMYEVGHSRWLAELKLDRRAEWRHYLIAGSEAYIEVIARDWQWRLGQVLRN